MFGYPMVVSRNGLTIKLRPIMEEELLIVVEGLSHLDIARYLQMTAPPTLEGEKEWWKRMGKSDEDRLWGIEFEGQLVGITGLHKIEKGESASSGIVIWERKLWGKGIASLAHLGRVWYVIKELHLRRIWSGARTVNEASLKALLRVGYTIWGTKLWDVFRDGKWLSTYELLWLNPRRVGEFGEEPPEKYKEGIKNAEMTLVEAEKWVSFC